MSFLQLLPMTNVHGYVPAELNHLSETLSVWRARYRQRRELAQWSERELADIGLNAAGIADEVNKPFWQA